VKGLKCGPTGPTSPPSLKVPVARVPEIMEVESESVETPRPKVGVVAPLPVATGSGPRRISGACKISGRQLLSQSFEVAYAITVLT